MCSNTSYIQQVFVTFLGSPGFLASYGLATFLPPRRWVPLVIHVALLRSNGKRLQTGKGLTTFKWKRFTRFSTNYFAGAVLYWLLYFVPVIWVVLLRANKGRYKALTIFNMHFRVIYGKQKWQHKCSSADSVNSYTNVEVWLISMLDLCHPCWLGREISFSGTNRNLLN